MTKQEEIRKGMEEILGEELIEFSLTHENAPPHKDCGEECKVDIIDQVASANPIMSPMRSGGIKHKKCMDCWNEYIDGLITKILKKQASQGIVIKVGRELPNMPFDVPEIGAGIFQAGLNSMLKAGYAAFEPLIEEGK